jgi:type IV pilus assembly protein PilF
MSIMARATTILVVLLTVGCATDAQRQDEDRSDSPANINVKLGVGYMQQGDYALALSKLRRALEQNPDSVGAHNAIALLYSRLGETDAAEQHFQDALRLSPDDTGTLNNYGVFLCEHNKPEKSEPYFLRAVKDPVYPGRAEAYENLGLCAERIPDLAKAEGYFRKALELRPTLGKSLLEMARMTYEAGEYLRARAYLQRYSEVAPHSPQSLWLGIRIERELGDKDAQASYAMLLRGKFPTSDEAQKLAAERGR